MIQQRDSNDLYQGKIGIECVIARVNGEKIEDDIYQFRENIVEGSVINDDRRVIVREIECDRLIPIVESVLVRAHLPFQPVQLYPYDFTLMIKPKFTEENKHLKIPFALKIYCDYNFDFERI